MASAKNTFETPKFILSPHQQDLLFAALNSNRGGPNSGSLQQSGISGMDSMAFDNSPLEAPGSSTMPTLDDSPFVDYDYEFDNAAGDFGDFDFTPMPQGQMIGTLPGTSSDGGDAQGHDKRGLSEDDIEDDEHDGKRREGDEKGAKKPGRKPLTSEPTSKRKAQNRAAQRAFRERKEKHLKDLETKVQDLEKASESANHENLLLRAKVEKMANELKEYKKRVSLNGGKSGAPSMPAYLREASGNVVSNPQDVNFSFEFPKFGKLPGPATNPSKSASHVPQLKSTTSPGSEPSRSTSFTSTASPLSHNSLSFGANQSMPNLEHGGSFSNIFGQHNGLDDQAELQTSTSRSSLDSSIANSSNGHNTSQSSPASSNSHGGPSSSCGTSPEPYTQSPPAAKALDSALTTIGEEEIKLTGDATQNNFCEKLSMVCGSPLNPVPRTMPAHKDSQNSSNETTNQSIVQHTNFDYNSLDWFAAQNNNAFDPQLFNDYREPQDSILSGGLYEDAFFNEAFAMPADLGSPFNFDAGAVPSGVTPKKDLISEIDDKLDDDDEVVPAESQMLTCTNMWDKIQACPRVQNGDIDMDQLCTELQQKAKCSGEGPVIQEKDFKEVLNSMFIANGMAPCTD